MFSLSCFCFFVFFAEHQHFSQAMQHKFSRLNVSNNVVQSYHVPICGSGGGGGGGGGGLEGV